MLLAELHTDLFSHHARPLEVDIFVAVDERGEYAISDEVCLRYNGKHQRRRRGGRSVQLPDWFMVLHSSSRDIYERIRTYHVRPNTFDEKGRRKPARRSGLGMKM